MLTTMSLNLLRLTWLTYLVIKFKLLEEMYFCELFIIPSVFSEQMIINLKLDVPCEWELRHLSFYHFHNIHTQVDKR